MWRWANDVRSYFAIVIKFSSSVDCDSCCSSTNFFQKTSKRSRSSSIFITCQGSFIHQFSIHEYSLFVTSVGHRLPLVKVGRWTLFTYGNEKLSLVTFYFVLFALYAVRCHSFGKHSPLCVCMCLLKWRFFSSPVSLLHSQPSWKRKSPCSMFEKAEEKKSFCFHQKWIVLRDVYFFSWRLNDPGAAYNCIILTTNYMITTRTAHTHKLNSKSNWISKENVPKNKMRQCSRQIVHVFSEGDTAINILGISVCMEAKKSWNCNLNLRFSESQTKAIIVHRTYTDAGDLTSKWTMMN